jgi:hypothetical protein
LIIKTGHGFKIIVCVLVIVISVFSQPDDDDEDIKIDENSVLSKTFSSRLTRIKKIGIAPVSFDCYYLTAGGVREYIDSSSVVSRDLILHKLKSGLSGKKFTVNQFSGELAMDEQFKKLQRFYDVINSQIAYNIYGEYAFQKPTDLITYTFPPIEEFFSLLNVDAILLVSGFDDQSTNRRRQLKAGAVAGAIAGAVLASVIGVGGYTVIPADYTLLNAVIIDRKGEIVWYNTTKYSGYKDMNDPEVVDKLVGKLIQSVKGSD